MEKADIVRMSSKGQVVIPQDLRQKLGLGAKSQLLVYRYADTLIMKKLDVKDVEKRLGALYRRIDARTAKIVRTRSRFRVIKEDPEDNTILAVAHDAKADYAVSGDGHLLGLKEFEGTRIVTVGRMLDILRSSPRSS